ncbi:MAG: RsmD family RNA methyltransferase [Chloroflexi bacterium]|nr:RsmD family RNA methyltransferase [Chloroflexota bacterium]
MRVIAGSARGRPLKGPPGRASDVRPSSDLVRGALFDSLAALGADFTHTLDLYAGTGALGIEALSRGGESCHFVEKNRAMADVIRENLDALAFTDSAQVIVAPVERAIERLTGPYTLVLADPPYADPAAIALLERLAQSGAIDGDHGTIALEHSTREEAAAAIGPFLLVRSLRHGDSSVSIYRPD